ncbi:hypothetical protein PENTCL1PPCAC_17916 [Pristionchus entomophagus]|uniref:Mlcd-1 n=1 Tax=Pristionchus entomophagus TaxID=358040 RepID=A0AAV5TN26_9BILA|nr:hypothetical protein PENTCL1PPCAC_17916 [Pristionchus entomophagus]
MLSPRRLPWGSLLSLSSFPPVPPRIKCSFPRYMSSLHNHASCKGTEPISSLSEALENLGHDSSSDFWAVASEKFKTIFNSTDSSKKTELLLHLGNNFGVDKAALDLAVAVYQRNPSATNEVRRAATPLYQLLFQSVGNRFGGVHCVCHMRAHLLEALDGNPDPVLKRIEESTKELLTTWFCLSNLTLERLTWQSPADILHKVAKYEAVHPVAGITDLQRRVGASRRCFLFTHEAMPREPLVVVHVALTRDIADNLQDILKWGREEGMEDEEATTAIYYSISSTQKGLAGIDLGNLLIKGVVEELQRDLPRVKIHSTLSPIPGFRAWVLRSLKGNSEFGDIMDDKIGGWMNEVAGRELELEESKNLLIQSLSANRMQPENIEGLKNILLRLCAVYIMKAKRNGLALNPVANFHVRNGAQVYRLNWAADSSVRGMDRSFGIMINYKYNLEDLHRNSEDYTRRKQINAHSQITELLD